MSYDPEDLVFSIGSSHQGMMTEVWLLDKAKVGARDPEGLVPVDTSRVIGMPPKYNRTPPGVGAMSSYFGTPEETRKALEAAGVTEAPVTWDIETEGLAYVTKDTETTSRIAPKARSLHRVEAVTAGDIKATKVFLFHRFPGEADWPATLDSLPEVVAQSIPFLDADGTFVTAHDAEMVSDWLAKGRVAKDIA